MKSNKYILALIAMVMCVFVAFSQTRAIGHMSVTIVSPVYMTSIQDASLGSVSFASAKSKNSLSASSRNLSNAAGIEILNEGNVSLASFKVSANGAAYSITLPEEPVLTSKNSKNMKVSGFNTIKSSSTSNYDNTENIVIGAKVEVNNEEAYGLYTSATPLRVTVNYN